jgi:hypothetical protein
MTNSHHSFLQELRQLLTTHFSYPELNTLCFDLSIVYDDLPGERRTDKAQELIEYLYRRQRLPDLITLLQRERPKVNWPDIPKEFAFETTSPDRQASSAPGSTFNISGSIKGGSISIGGTQTITDNIEVDMRETHVHQPSGRVHSGDHIEMSGDFREAIVTVKSHLDQARQTIQAVPYGDKSQKQVLLQQIAELQAQLAQAPPAHAEAAAKVARSVEHLAYELQAEPMDKEMARITGEGLKKAAENLKEVMPTVLTIATQIVNYILHLIA